MVKTGITGLSDGESTTVVVSVSRLSRGVFSNVSVSSRYRHSNVSVSSQSQDSDISVSSRYHTSIYNPGININQSKQLQTEYCWAKHWSGRDHKLL